MAEVINQNPPQDNSMTVLVHITYAMNIFLSFWGLIASVVLFFLSKNPLLKGHLRYIIKMNIIYYIISIGSILLLLLLGLGTLLGLDAFSLTEIIKMAFSSNVSISIETEGARGLSSLLFIAFWFVFILNIVVFIWFIIKMIIGWVALFRKQPILEHFDLQFSKK